MGPPCPSMVAVLMVRNGPVCWASHAAEVCMDVQDPEALSRLAETEDADVICLQETKLQGKATDTTETLLGLPGWQYLWSCSTARLGYSGTAIFCRSDPRRRACPLQYPFSPTHTQTSSPLIGWYSRRSTELWLSRIVAWTVRMTGLGHVWHMG